jgi:hypothetical protein
MTKLTDLDPQWVTKDGRRIGFVFVSPAKPQWRQSCFVEKVPHRDQQDAFTAMFGAPHAVQGCNQDMAWTVEGGIENASFDTMTVRPSIDGSAGGLWHGFITNGQIT